MAPGLASCPVAPLHFHKSQSKFCVDVPELCLHTYRENLRRVLQMLQVSNKAGLKRCAPLHHSKPTHDDILKVCVPRFQLQWCTYIVEGHRYEDVADGELCRSWRWQPF